MHDYRAPAWLRGGAWGAHVQTIWPALASRRFEGPAPAWQRERWATPDGDFVDADWQDPPGASPETPLLVLFHGLEGSSASHYAQAAAFTAGQRGWRIVVPHFRGCSGEPNRAARAYHSGDHEEIAWMLAQCRVRHPAAPMFALGISLGGNALLRWAQEHGKQAGEVVRAVAAVSAPLDLAASGHAIGRGANRLLYTPMFLRTMQRKARLTLKRHPGLFDRDRMLAARTLHAFDDVYTAPLHGFRDADDYWRRASAAPHLNALQVPSLVVNARNDPFVPADSLPDPDALRANTHLTLWQPAHGGHVGFATGAPPGHVLSLPRAVMDWMQRHL